MNKKYNNNNNYTTILGYWIIISGNAIIKSFPEPPCVGLFIEGKI